MGESSADSKTATARGMIKVLWSNGKESWVRKENLPETVRVKEDGSCLYFVKEKVEFGQTQTLLVEEGDGQSISRGVQSTGFAIHNDDDIVVRDEDGLKRKLLCCTEKDKVKAKNHKTAGILVFERPCAIVVEIKELFNCESKSQVYGHLHNLLELDGMKETSVICYDDACHLLKFARNECRSKLTDTSRAICQLDIVCDKFHFKNHTDSWCRKFCNPYKCNRLNNVNTEVCEQTFSWLSKYKTMTKHMNRWRFLFLMLYILNLHNCRIEKKCSQG